MPKTSKTIVTESTAPIFVQAPTEHLTTVRQLADAVKANAEAISRVAESLRSEVHITNCNITTSGTGISVQ